jgi:hypothetical protein
VEKSIVLSASTFSGMTARPAGDWDFSKEIFLNSASETVEERIHYQDTHTQEQTALEKKLSDKKSGAGVQP